jgi:3-oxoacyl-[acyl-carrier protein] reductase
MNLHYSGKRALILGGSCELALGLAKSVISHGLFPVMTHRSKQGRSRIKEALHGVDGRYASFNLDLSAPTTLSLPRDQSGRGIDYLVDFVQGDLEGLVASADSEAVRSYFETNIANRARVIQDVARAMVARRKGRMVYVSSSAAGRPNPGQGFYAAVKQASEALYRNLGLELASRGVTTVTLRPGYVNAGRGHRYLEKKADAALARVPLGRALETSEVVDAIMFLLSDSAVGFNATVLTMDGGLAAGK